MINVIVAGFKGKMGSEATNMILENEAFQLVGVLDPRAEEKNINEMIEWQDKDVPVFTTKEEMVKHVSADVWVDFTTPTVAFEHLSFAIEHNISPVFGTTGLSPEELEQLQHKAASKKVGGLIAPNFAIGAVLMMQFSKKAAEYFSDVEIIESHHQHKVDAPSGTAIKTAEMIASVRDEKQQGHPDEKELIKGARGADYEGMKIHSVRLPGLVAHQQVLFGSLGETLTIKHDSYDRSSFMSGVALGITKVVSMDRLVYGLEELL